MVLEDKKGTMEDKFEKLKEACLMEKDRLGTFKEWAFDETSPCNIKKMAEAGFYWNGNDHGDDTVTCFLCGKTLDGWEANDDPWKEHEKHAPQCTFVKCHKSEAELTVEEFLVILRECVKNLMLKNMTNQLKELRLVAEKMQNQFRMGKRG